MLYGAKLHLYPSSFELAVTPHPLQTIEPHHKIVLLKALQLFKAKTAIMSPGFLQVSTLTIGDSSLTIPSASLRMCPLQHS